VLAFGFEQRNVNDIDIWIINPADEKERADALSSSEGGAGGRAAFTR